VVPADTNASTLLANSIWTSAAPLGYIPGVIKEYQVSGGDADVETDPVFGGFVDKEKPRAQYEIQLTIVPAIEGSSSFDFHDISLAKDSGTTTVLTSAGIGSDRAFFIQANSGSVYKSYGFNNCSITTHEMSHNADDNMEQNVTLKFSPTTDSGKPNFQFSKVAVASLLAWSALSASTV
jgi:hypothetical protein